MYNLHGVQSRLCFVICTWKENERSGHVSFPPTDPPVWMHLSHPDSLISCVWGPGSGPQLLQRVCPCLFLCLLSAPHSICQDPRIPRLFMLGLWANTFPLEVHFSAGQRHPWPWVPGLPILLLTCLVTSIPTDARFLASLDPWEPVSTLAGGQGLRVQTLPAPVHPVKPLTPWQHRNLP